MTVFRVLFPRAEKSVAERLSQEKFEQEEVKEDEHGVEKQHGPGNGVEDIEQGRAHGRGRQPQRDEREEPDKEKVEELRSEKDRETEGPTLGFLLFGERPRVDPVGHGGFGGPGRQQGLPSGQDRSGL